MPQAEKKKYRYRWGVPLFATILCMVLEVAFAGGINRYVIELFFSKSFFAFVVFIVIYNWGMDWLDKKNHGKKPPKVELALALPFFAVFLIAIIPPFVLVRRWLLTAGLLLMGYELWALGLGYWLQETRLRRICTVQVTAVVLSNVQARTDTRPGEASTKTYFPVLVYEANGRRLETQYEHGQPRPMEVNRRVEICYNPQTPTEFCFLEQRENKALTFGVPFMLTMATGVLVAAVLSIVFQWSV